MDRLQVHGIPDWASEISGPLTVAPRAVSLKSRPGEPDPGRRMEEEGRSGRVLIEIAARHGSLGPAQHDHLQQKAEKLLKHFGRLMSIEVQAEHRKHDWLADVLVSAEHRHDFVARDEGVTAEAAMAGCVHKVDEQLRRFKEKVQWHHGGLPQGGTWPTHPDLTEPPPPASGSSGLDEHV